MGKKDKKDEKKADKKKAEKKAEKKAQKVVTFCSWLSRWLTSLPDAGQGREEEVEAREEGQEGQEGRQGQEGQDATEEVSVVLRVKGVCVTQRSFTSYAAYAVWPLGDWRGARTCAATSWALMRCPPRRHEIYLDFPAPRRMLMIGCGAIGGGLLPLLFRHVKVSPDQILVISAGGDDEKARCEEFGIKWRHVELLESNYEALLTPLMNKDDLCLNMSSCVSSLAIIKLCQQRQVLYIDSSNETWNDRCAS